VASGIPRDTAFSGFATNTICLSPVTVSILFDPDTDTDPDPEFIRFPLSFSFRQRSH
jgi:hypothetical protein